MISRTFALFAALTVAALLAACGHDDDHVERRAPLTVPFQSSIHDSSIVATIEYGGRTDTFRYDDFRQNMERLSALFPEVMADDARSEPIRQEMIRQYALEHLLIDEAERRGLIVDSADIEAELARFKSRFGSEEGYRAELADIHQTEEGIRDQFRSTIVRDALIQSIEDSLPGPTPEEIETFREAMSTRLRVQHILVGVPEDASPESLAISRNKALALLDSLEDGSNFAMLARRYSDDPGSKVSGGEIPWFRRGEMVPEFEEAAFRLKNEGDYTTKPVRTSYGYHIIRLLEREKDDAITSDSARALLVKRRVRAAHEELQRRLVGQAVVRTNPAFIPQLATTESSVGG